MNLDNMYISDNMTLGEYKKTPEYRINSLSSTVFYICIGHCGDKTVNNKTMNQRIAYAAAVIKAKNPELEDMIWARVSENITLNRYQYPGKNRNLERQLYERI